MWDDSEQYNEKYLQFERSFQKMLVNNMDSVLQIFFRGMSVIRIRTQNSAGSSGVQNIAGLKSLK